MSDKPKIGDVWVLKSDNNKDAQIEEVHDGIPFGGYVVTASPRFKSGTRGMCMDTFLKYYEKAKD